MPIHTRVSLFTFAVKTNSIGAFRAMGKPCYFHVTDLRRCFRLFRKLIVPEHLPINWIACGKKLAKFWLQWSLIGICMYFIEPALSNTFGKSGVTLSMYCILCRANASRSSLLAALPRYKWGKISTGKSLSSSGPATCKHEFITITLHATSNFLIEPLFYYIIRILRCFTATLLLQNTFQVNKNVYSPTESHVLSLSESE